MAATGPMMTTMFEINADAWSVGSCAIRRPRRISRGFGPLPGAGRSRQRIAAMPLVASMR